MVYFLLLFIIPVILFILYFHLQYDLFIIEQFNNNNNNDEDDEVVDQKKQVQDQLDRYYSYIYPLNEKITNYEKDFIEKWIHKLNENDYQLHPHISPFSVGINIFKNGHINKSRFCIGTKTSFDEFKLDTNKLFHNLRINIEPPHNYNYYGVAWDIEDNLIKLYFLSKDFTKIICYIYKVKRNKNKIEKISFIDTKNYNVGVETTIMRKNGKIIKQHNTNNGKIKIPNEILKKYPESRKWISLMEPQLEVNTYSEYDNKLSIYFD